MIMGSMEAQKSVVYITSNSSSILKFLMAIMATFFKIILKLWSQAMGAIIF